MQWIYELLIRELTRPRLRRVKRELEKESSGRREERRAVGLVLRRVTRALAPRKGAE